MPFRPSDILNALINPTTQKTVKMTEKKPNDISPEPKRFPRLFKDSPDKKIISKTIDI
jgi:hypothetical protein